MGDEMTVIELPRPFARTDVDGALMSWSDSGAECTVAIARPTDNDPPLARTGCQVLAVTGVQFCMATGAQHVLARWRSSGGSSLRYAPRRIPTSAFAPR